MNKISLYNKTSIFIFSIFLTGFGGSLMMGYNLRQVGKNKIVVPLVLISLVGNAVLRAIVKGILPGSLYAFFIPNVIWGLALIFPVWNTYLGEIATYANKNIWIPLTVVVVLWGGLLLFRFLG